MLNCLSGDVKRAVTACNFNIHINSSHPDRRMEDHDLIYIRDGSWIICQDDCRFELSSQDVLLLHGRHRHYGPSPYQGSVKTIFIHFSHDDGDLLLSAHPDTFHEKSRKEKPEGEKEGPEALLPAHNRYLFPSLIHCRNNPVVENYFRQIHSAYWSDSPLSANKASAYLDLLLCELSRMQNEPSSDPLAADLIHLIQETPGRFFTMQELSDRFGFSGKTLSVRFKAATGSTIHDYQMDLKCQMANELMACNPSLTLREIAHTFGFYDEFHFSKCFKKKYRCSPKAFSMRQA